MPYPRIIGKKLVIFHSKRVSGRVKQMRLHSFDSFQEALDLVESDHQWELFCQTLTGQFGIKIDKTKLGKAIKERLDSVDVNRPDPVNDAVLKILSFLENCDPPLSPSQITTLGKIKENLLKLRDSIDDKFKLMEDPMTSYMMIGETEADKCLEYGLDLYSEGRWDAAKSAFLKGLKAEPDHVDLNVHAGLIELIYNNYQLALNYFEKAFVQGKQSIDALIASQPDNYIKYVDREKRAENKLCEWADECPDLFSEKCKGCEKYPVNILPELYQYHRLRPFFRAMTNQAFTLMHLKRYEKAIDILMVCREYQPLWGTSNMIGICWLNIGKLEKADAWYTEFLWNDVYYIKALIKYLKGNNNKAIGYLLTGTIKNPHIAWMLTGIEQPESTRYLGHALPDRLKASEFFHEDGYLFKKHPGFKRLIQCILENTEVSDLIKDLETKKQRRENERNYKMDSFSWDLLYGNMKQTFINQYVASLLEQLEDKAGPYWMPDTGNMIQARILEIKQQNWRVELEDVDKDFYFRPKEHEGHHACGQVISILVTKSWFYRKRLFVSGRILS